MSICCRDWPSRNLHEWLRDESLASAQETAGGGSWRSNCRAGYAKSCWSKRGWPRIEKPAALTKEERQRLVSSLKHLSIPITGTLGFKKAEVTAGGVALDEVDSQNDAEQARAQSLFGRRNARSRRPHRRLQLPGRLEHRLARREFGVTPAAACGNSIVVRRSADTFSPSFSAGGQLKGLRVGSPGSKCASCVQSCHPSPCTQSIFFCTQSTFFCTESTFLATNGPPLRKPPLCVAIHDAERRATMVSLFFLDTQRESCNTRMRFSLMNEVCHA